MGVKAMGEGGGVAVGEMEVYGEWSFCRVFKLLMLLILINLSY